MGKLSNVSWNELVKVLSLIGYAVDHQKGSHLILIKQGFGRTVVPKRDSLPKGTLRAILRQTGFSVEDFLNLLEKV
ncbi:MAG: type II toxin-antitoxin system HicA family toxin [Candidatus Diapherotrites archaeon]|nr:type II toxin-antitoxin system HicA family toxin [Candidatus Diapherotrites archaeon]